MFIRIFYYRFLAMKHTSLFILVSVLALMSNLKFVCGRTSEGYISRNCIESEKHALLLFKEDLVDHSNILSSWVGDDCCSWRGIGCSNITGHVTQLQLGVGSLTGDTLFLPHLI